MNSEKVSAGDETPLFGRGQYASLPATKPRPRILAVESQNGEAELLTALAEEANLEIVICPAGDEGLRRADSEPFDVILLDMTTADLSGYEICRKLKARHETSEIPIIFIARRDHEEDMLSGFEALAFDVVLKPFHPRELRLRLQNALRHKLLLDDLRTRVRCYERCLRIGRALAEADSPERAEAIITRELDELWRDLDASGLSYSLDNAPDLFVCGDVGERLAAEIPFHHAGLKGTLRLYREQPCDADERALLAEILGTLTRGIRRNPALLPATALAL